MTVEIEMTMVDDARSLVSGRPELWLRVRSQEALDLDRIKKHLTPAQLTTLAAYGPKPAAYYPDAEDGWLFVDWFIFGKTFWSAA